MPENAPKYSKDAPFTDPVVRCDSCQSLVLREKMLKIGMCTECGNRRMRSVQIMKPEEWQQVKSWGVDPDFIALFEEVADE